MNMIYLTRLNSLIIKFVSKYINSMSNPTSEQIQEALAFKEAGNNCFKEKNYDEAVQMYTKAIQKNPKYSIFYSNRARCYFNLQKYEQSFADAEISIKLDDKNIKAYYIAAQSLVETAVNTKDKTKIQNAIQRLKKSLTLCPSQGKGDFQRKFVDQIYLAKKKLWNLNNESQLIKRKQVRKYLINLIQTDQTLTEETKDALNQRVLKLLEEENIEKSARKIPTALICPITKMILKDPVCNQYGHSYSRMAYIKYLQQNQSTDPITKNKIKLNYMYTNINVKKAIEMFLQKHPWAYDEIINL